MIKNLDVFLLAAFVMGLSFVGATDQSQLIGDIGESQPTSIAPATHLNVSNDWFEKDYAENALLQEKWARRFFFDSYVFEGNEIILDIGCGDGKISAWLAKEAPKGEVIGIDLSNSLITIAQNTYSDLTNLKFIQQNAQDSSFYQKYLEYFKLITSFTALHWMQSQEMVLQGTYTALKKSGKFYARLSSKGGDPMYDIAIELARQHVDYCDDFKNFEDPIIRYDPEEYKALLEGVGFIVTSIKDVEERDELQGEEELAQQIKSYLPHYRHLQKKASSEKAEAYIKLLIKEYVLRHPKNEDGTITLYDHYLEVIGEKQ